MDITALQIIKALKIGKVPHVGTMRLCVGRDAEIAEFRHVLEFVKGGGFEARFLRGDYGAGKTFLCSVVRELAFEAGMLVSILNLNREIPFGRRDLVLASSLRGLRSVTSGTTCAMGEILETWLGKYDPGIPLEQNVQLSGAIARTTAGDPGFAMALRAYYRAYLDGDELLKLAAIDWLRGDSIAAEARSALKVVGKIAAEGAFRRLRAFCALLRDAGYPGLVVLIDEVESVSRLAKPQRDAAFSSMREIIDTGEIEFPHTLWLFAGTQPFFEDEFRGVASFQPLWQRIRSQQVYSQRDLRQPIIRLEEFGGDSLLAVSEKVRELHGLAYEWNACDQFRDQDVRRLISAAGAKFGMIKQKPRTYLKSLVDALDARNQHLDTTLEMIVQNAEGVERDGAALDDDIIEAAV
jgi:hypothetical protein